MKHTIPLRSMPAMADWREQLRDVIKSADELLDELGLTPAEVGYSARASSDFALKVPHAFVRRMRHGDPRDPLLLQVLASGRELLEQPGFGDDPNGETGSANPCPGIIHKYHGRVLLVVTGACAVNCRYCFRRHFPYGDNQNSRDDWHRALEHVRRDVSITEVILSGGDPLLAGDDHLARLCRQIADIPHVRAIRVHTRLPIVLPDRITTPLLDALCPPGLKTVMVVHANHGNELDQAVAEGFAHIRARGVTLLNQSVLLAGVNNSSGALVELSERLFEAGALPYYLHLLDRVRGAAHFDVSELEARQLHRQVTAQLPGYLVPRLVREVAGATAKTGIAPLA